MKEKYSPMEHLAQMERKKAARDKMMAKKSLSRGLILVNTGPAKGKTTAGLGMVLRALGHGMKVGVVQFVKGAWESGERQALSIFGDQIALYALGEGFSWETQDKERDLKAARKAWEKTLEMLSNPELGLILLDEINIVLRDQLLPVEAVIAALKTRPEHQHVILTGRGAPSQLIEAADMVTEMALVKHHFKAGFKAQPGVEF